MAGFMISLQMLEDNYPLQPGFPRRLIQKGIDTMVAALVQGHQSETDIDRVIADALGDGLKSRVYNPIGSWETLFKSTDDYFDLVLYVGGACSFNDFLLVAGQDSRFDKLFKNVGRTASS
jgi:hypothetical protein